MKEENPNKSFKVEDHRRFDDKGDFKEGAGSDSDSKGEGKSRAASGGQGDAAKQQFPPINFATFLLSLASSAQVHLGLVPDPGTNETKASLHLAKQTIDILGMIREKTKGNLEEHEEKLLEQILFELRMQFLECQKT